MQYVAQRVAKIRLSVSTDRSELVRKNRLKIVNSATKLFRKNGFYKTTTQDICDAIGVSQGHIYQYISHKDDILLLMLQVAVDEYNDKLFSLLESDAGHVEKLTRAIEVYYRIINRHRDKTHVLYHHISSLTIEDRRIFDAVEADVTNFFQSIVENGVKAGAFSTDNPFIIAFNIVSLGHMWALKYHRFKNRMTLERYIQEQTLFLLQACNHKHFDASDSRSS